MDEANSQREGNEPEDRPFARNVGIVVVHGVMPHPRYQIQDDCAANLRKALNHDRYWSTVADGGGPGKGRWVASVLNPQDSDVVKDLAPHPTISRVRIDGDPVMQPKYPYFDVIEAYWSPLDKGKTTFARVATWLLRTIVVPLNTTAEYVAPPGKTAYDVGFVLAGIAAVILGLAGALIVAVLALNDLIVVSATCPSPCAINAWNVVFDPSKIGKVFSPGTLAVLAMGAAGAVLIVQAIQGAVAMAGQSRALKRKRHQRTVRIVLIVGVAAVGAVLLCLSAFAPILPNQNALGRPALWFIVAAVLFIAGRTVAQSFLVNFFADVEIYTTRDENADFFATRDQILDCVTKTIVHTCSDAANGGQGYDRVFILGHSLGSTIALDALMRFSNLCEQDPAPNPRVNLRHTFDRIRAFVTFGSPLEKTKYFFDVTNPSPSAAQEQWRNDAYGPLFTADARCLDGPNGATRGMYWGNYWYFKDAIANELLSFASFVGLGASASQGHHIRHLLAVAVRHGRIAVGPDEALAGRRVCRNEQGHKGFVVPAILPHGEYLGDQGWFWRTDTAAEHLGVLDIVARTTGAPYAPAETCYTTPWGATYRVVAAAERARISDQYSVPPLGADVPSNPDAPAERDENDAGTHADDRGHAHVLAVAEYDGDHRAKKTTTDSR